MRLKSFLTTMLIVMSFLVTSTAFSTNKSLVCKGNKTLPYHGLDLMLKITWQISYPLKVADNTFDGLIKATIFGNEVAGRYLGQLTLSNISIDKVKFNMLEVFENMETGEIEYEQIGIASLSLKDKRLYIFLNELNFLPYHSYKNLNAVLDCDVIEDN